MPTNLSRMTVLLARGRELERAINANQPADALDDAVRQLMRAATEPADLEPAAIQRFEPDPNRRQTDPSADEALAAIAFELHAGNVLVAAARAIPDERSGRAGEPETLRAALQALESIRQTVEGEVSPQVWSRFEAKITEVNAEVTAENAAARFKASAEAALDTFTKASEEVITKSAELLRKMDPSKVLAGIEQFGRASEALTAAGTLLRLGLSKIRDAYNALVRLFGAELLQNARSRVEQVWTDFKEGKYTRQLIVTMYGTKHIKGDIATALARPTLAPEPLIRACAAVAPLEGKFRKHMAILSGILSGTTTAVAVLAVTPIKLQAAPFIASAYLLVLAAVIILGMEYSGVSWSLHWVKGVGVIVGELGPVDVSVR